MKTTTDERREDDEEEEEDEKRENDWIRGVVASSSLGRKATATLTAVCVSLAPLGAEAVEFIASSSSSVQIAVLDDEKNGTNAAALANETREERIQTMMDGEQR